ncbi:MAG TPA: bile acid:sodium symporter family protein [Rhodocyclaceae bacterium]|nr:bile acid:sodium symporter family protein [Rhodocyclaceae bacterium]HMZ83716.1 bile acid:sodium symporter family protein [Rhodocyclaceae bacterium]HNA03808.1 bile acid:sodium symporter family protein [Rhodocyclaceae bacterium]HNB77906.1 bile acid:sodium symporter family protein [Rhodocyclaceae bacterium]HNC60145.1 bile acid:sodium symporter family protein [Rhodocyclaceae bacterium]
MTPTIIDVLLPAALACIMFALGITLVPADFTRLLERPRAVLGGLFGQLIVLPAAAWALALAFRLPPEMAVGLVILGACPGGASSGLITYLARGETALSITLTAITSLVALASVPLVVNLALQTFLGAGGAVDLPVGRLVRGVFFITTVPVAAGMLLRAWRPALAARIERPAGRIATLLFLLIVIATFVSQREALFANMGSVGPATATLNALVMGAGVAIAALLRLSRRDAIAIAAECGLQNAALGIFIAATVLGSPMLAVPSVVYALLMNVGALGLIVVARRLVSRANPVRA